MDQIKTYRCAICEKILYEDYTYCDDHWKKVLEGLGTEVTLHDIKLNYAINRWLKSKEA